MLLSSASLGVVVGFLNPYVSSRFMAAGVGTLAAFPVAVAALFATGGAVHGFVEGFLVSAAVAAFVGGLYGAVAYRP